MSDVKDNEYVTPGSGVVKDDAPIDEPKVQDPDSDAQIGKCYFKQHLSRIS